MNDQPVDPVHHRFHPPVHHTRACSATGFPRNRASRATSCPPPAVRGLYDSKDKKMQRRGERSHQPSCRLCTLRAELLSIVYNQVRFTIEPESDLWGLWALILWLGSGWDNRCT